MDTRAAPGGGETLPPAAHDPWPRQRATAKILTEHGTLLQDADLDELLDVDLADPELHKAATKIQASFRGHKARKADDAVDNKQ